MAEPTTIIDRKLEFYFSGGIEVSVFLSNGIRLNGKIIEYDHTAVVLTSAKGPEGVTAARNVIATLMRHTNDHPVYQEKATTKR